MSEAPRWSVRKVAGASPHDIIGWNMVDDQGEIVFFSRVGNIDVAEVAAAAPLMAAAIGKIEHLAQDRPDILAVIGDLTDQINEAMK